MEGADEGWLPAKAAPSPCMSNHGETFPAWARSVEEVCAYYGVDHLIGLSEEDVQARRSIYGANELEKSKGTDFLALVLQQFDDALVRILIAAALVSLLLALTNGREVGEEARLEEFAEPVIIGAIVVLNAVIGVLQESKAETTLEALKEMQPQAVRVVRKGLEIPELPSQDLVPGDVVELRAGDKVPADLRVVRLKSGTFRLMQASLTGESQPVEKLVEATDEEDIVLQGKECIAFSGTTVSNGSCLGVVIATGMRTEIGKIQQQISDAGKVKYDTPLTRKLDEFSDTLTKVVAAICALVWIINYKYFLLLDFSEGLRGTVSLDLGQATYYFKVAVALAVAAIPEGLPAVITTCLALGTQRMAKANAIVRKLPSVETLGCTTVICSDKTGTLTTNQMAVVEVVVPGDMALEGGANLVHYPVQGTTYNPLDGGVENLNRKGVNPGLQTLAQVCALCNDAGLVYKDGAYNATGMPTEAALKVFAEKVGVPDERTQQKIDAARQADPEQSPLGACAFWARRERKLLTLEFDRTRKSMSVIVEPDDGLEGTGPNIDLHGSPGRRLLVKGAPECVLERCTHLQLSNGSVVPFSESLRDELAIQYSGLTSRALRVLAMAVKTNMDDELRDYSLESLDANSPLLLNPNKYASLENDLTFVGLVGLKDPPRPEVLPALQECYRAGIRVMVITGDNQNTAEAICREIGLFRQNEDLSLKSFTGSYFMRLPMQERERILFKDGQLRSGGFVFSRAEPAHKQEIVRLLQSGGQVVAMTGDGVNDAPALKLADIGVAMGITGTEVAKEAADMVLADDNFSTIVKAVREGRAIYDNMRSFIRYLISSNIGEVVSIFVTTLLGMPQGLIPVQLLWVNLVTDGAPATALGFNPPDGDIMKRPPRAPSESLINGWTLFRYMVIGTYVGVATVGIFALWYLNSDSLFGIINLKDGHTAISFHQLTSWGECSTWTDFDPAPFSAGSQQITFAEPCEYFTLGKVKASTLAMSTLVVIEMLNSLNSLSENNSLTVTRPWVNKWLLLAISVSMGLHGLILYTPLSHAFGVVPLTASEWLLVFLVSAPIIAIDEGLKLIGRRFFTPKFEELPK
eukprot:TRINITY_DN5488_c0_g1_i1.p1 TRINITY_DN5488_c0_g1~~TRINITY_DN5488_c0_g1_i1.p1  ORF type:complete len:1193 (-),score=197.07 TRINITY_DN5488_c0_g1_i1:406-3681(-)